MSVKVDNESQSRGDSAKPHFDLSHAAPVAKQHHTELITHGRFKDDPYAWLAADNWREILNDPSSLPEPIAHLVKAENDYCAKVVAPLAELRKILVEELRARIKEDDADVPDADGDYEYYGRFREGAEHSL